MSIVVAANEIDKYVGYEPEPSAWHSVTQEQINQFADCTLDHQFIHVDEERAAETMFGSTIAHGFLSLSMLSYFASGFMIAVDGLTMGVNSGFDKVRFLAPVKVNSRIRARATFTDIQETRPGQFRFTTSVKVEIEGEEVPALIAEWITIQFIDQSE